MVLVSFDHFAINAVIAVIIAVITSQPIRSWYDDVLTNQKPLFNAMMTTL